jgi:hypothetical protein
MDDGSPIIENIHNIFWSEAMTTITTQFQIDCALMAGAVYISTRAQINQLSLPAGWQIIQNPNEYVSKRRVGKFLLPTLSLNLRRFNI